MILFWPFIFFAFMLIFLRFLVMRTFLIFLMRQFLFLPLFFILLIFMLLLIIFPIWFTCCQFTLLILINFKFGFIEINDNLFVPQKSLTKKNNFVWTSHQTRTKFPSTLVEILTRQPGEHMTIHLQRQNWKFRVQLFFIICIILESYTSLHSPWWLAILIQLTYPFYLFCYLLGYVFRKQWYVFIDGTKHQWKDIWLSSFLWSTQRKQIFVTIHYLLHIHCSIAS